MLSLEPGATPGKTTLEASAATPTPAGEGRQAILAALTKSASGAPVFDRKGALEALVAPIKDEPKRVAGVVLVEPHALIALDAIKRFLGQAGAEAPAEAPAPRRRRDRAREARVGRDDRLPPMNAPPMNARGAARGARVLIFDSGLGGLTVLAGIARQRPDAELIYAADDAFFPYGALDEAALVARVGSVMASLIERHAPDLAVIACNTASTLVLPPLRAAFPDLPFVGTVPAIKPAAEASRRASSACWRRRAPSRAIIRARWCAISPAIAK